MRSWGGWVVLGLGACTDAPAPQTARAPIVHGVVDREQDAVVALLTVQGPRQSLCSGTLIDVRADEDVATVLTAAHCVVPRPPDLVVVGPDFADPAAPRYVTLDVRPHPLYSPTDDGYRHDVALLRIAGDVRGLVALALAPVAPRPQAGDPVDAYGFGALSSTAEPANTVRHTVSLVLERVAPRGAQGEAGVLHVDQATAGVCLGDSGGPLVAPRDGQRQVVGVVSQVFPRTLTGDPCTGESHSVPVADVRDFLDQQLARPPATECATCRAAVRSEGGICREVARACEVEPRCGGALDCVRSCETTLCRNRCLSDVDRSDVERIERIEACPCEVCTSHCPVTDVCAGDPSLRDAGAASDAGAPQDSSAADEPVDLGAPPGGGCDAASRRGPEGTTWRNIGLGLALLYVHRARRRRCADVRA